MRLVRLVALREGELLHPDGQPKIMMRRSGVAFVGVDPGATTCSARAARNTSLTRYMLLRPMLLRPNATQASYLRQCYFGQCYQGQCYQGQSFKI